MIGRFTTFVPALLVVALVCGRSTAQQTVVTGPSAVKGLPAQTTLLVHVRSGGDLYRKFKGSPFYALKDHPGIKQFLDDMEREMKSGLAEAREDLGFDPVDLVKQFEGEVVLAVGGLDKIIAGVMAEMAGGSGAGQSMVKPGDLPVIIVADAGANAPKVREYMAKIHDTIQKEGGSKAEEDFRGGKITEFTHTQASGSNDLEKIFFAELGTKFLVSINRPYLEETMAGMTGAGTSSLGDDPDFAATGRELGPSGDTLMFLNVKSLMDSFRKTVQANPFVGMFFGLIEEKLIGKGLKNIAIAGTLESDGYESISFFNNGGVRGGLFALLDAPSFSPSQAADGIPPNVETLSVFAFNFQKLYQLVREIANTVIGITQGNPGMDVEQILEMQLQVKMQELIGSLGSRAFYYNEAGSGGADAAPADPFSNPLGNVVFGLDLKDEGPVRTLLAKLPAIIQQNPMLAGTVLKADKYMERDVYQFDTDGPVLALVDKQLVVGGSGDSVKALIRRRGSAEAKSLSETAEFRTQIQSLPSSVWGVSFVRKGFLKKSMAPVKMLLEAEADLPDIDPVLDVLGASTGYSLWKESGLYSRSRIAFDKE